MAFVINLDFAKLAQVQRAFQELGVGYQADLHKHTSELDVMHIISGAVFVAQAIDLATFARDFGGLRVGVDGHVGQAFQLVDQHGIGLELVGKLNQGHVLNQTGQIDGGFHA